LKFKESTEFPDKKENILSAANILGMIDNNRTLSDIVKKYKSLVESLVFMLRWDNCSQGLSDYVCSRLIVFERERKTNQEISSWLRSIARKIELSPHDIKFKNSPNMPNKQQIKLAAQALENSTRQQTSDVEDVAGERRSSVGVLLVFMNVRDGEAHALSEHPGEAIRMSRQSGDKERENFGIATPELRELLSDYIVNRIRYFDGYERYSFKDVAQWLRLFLID
jgi:hypothetical protein